MTTSVDARGLSCPQPVIITRKAMKRGGKRPIEVLVMTGTSRDNVSRMARREGWQVEAVELEDGFKLILSQ
ncbi:MAG: sulfurtransferase TusA family protein [Anaerolineae bacterium]|jgi:TusA-related sulfurtransferase